MSRWFQYRCFVLCAFLVIALSGLSWRLIQIQYVDRQEYAERANRAFLRIETLPAIRGMIVDRNEEPLAISVPVATLHVDKNHLMDPKLASYGLAYRQASNEAGWAQLDPGRQMKRINELRAEILDSREPADVVAEHLAHAASVLAIPLRTRRDELRRKILENNSKWFPVAKDIPDDDAEEIRDIIDKHWLQGFQFENSIKRSYSSPKMLTHVVGFTGEKSSKDEDGKLVTRMVGKFGIESAMEEYLAGRDGRREHRRDRRGLVLPGDAESVLPPKSGYNVKLTVDMGLQAIVEEEIDAALQEYVAEAGAVVLMDPKTGDVLAMASRPHFDLNLRENLDKASLHYALQATYEPGSTIKVVAAAGALDAGRVVNDTQIFCHNGHYSSGKVTVQDEHPASYLSVAEVLKKSNNIGSYMLGLRLGQGPFYEYLANFGFGRKTGILLSDEKRGIARNTNNAVDFSRACFGYSLNVTPLQVACAYSVLAGDGRLLKPRIIDSLVANNGFVLEKFPVETVCQTIKPATARRMREALQLVTEKGGTATRAAVPGFKVAGKTGTAKKSHVNRLGYSDDRVVSFVGMMPAQEPAFVCVVVIDTPRTTAMKRQGGMIAAPVFAKIASRVAARMDLQPTEPIQETPLANTRTP